MHNKKIKKGEVRRQPLPEIKKMKKINNGILADAVYDKLQAEFPETYYLNSRTAIKDWFKDFATDEDLYNILFCEELREIGYNDVLDIVDGDGSYDFLVFSTEDELNDFIEETKDYFIGLCNDKVNEITKMLNGAKEV